MMLWKVFFSDTMHSLASSSGYARRSLPSTGQSAHPMPGGQSRGMVGTSGASADYRGGARARGGAMAEHPLEPLVADEFRLAARVLRSELDLSDSWRFASIELKEPPKAEVKAWRPGDAVPRTAMAVLWNRTDNQTWEGVVDLTGERVVSWTHVEGVTPNFTVDEFHEVDAAMRVHPDVIAVLEKRGITDLSLVVVDVWTYGKAMMPEKYADRRLGWCDIWRRETPDGNPYGHPVSGLKVIVDVNTLELLEIEDQHDYG